MKAAPTHDLDIASARPMGGRPSDPRGEVGSVLGHQGAPATWLSWSRLGILWLGLLAGCASVPDDDRPASQRAADAAGRAVAVPLGVVIEMVAGPVLGQIERAGERMEEKRRTRRAVRDARDLCLADPTLFAEACAIAFPEFMSAEGGETEAAPGRSETGEPGESGTLSRPEGAWRGRREHRTAARRPVPGAPRRSSAPTRGTAPRTIQGHGRSLARLLWTPDRHGQGRV